MDKISLEILGKSIANVKDIRDNKIDSALMSGIFLFFSFDLSNSTAFKIEHPSLWANVFTSFYEEILKRLGVENYKTQESEYDDTKSVRKLWKLIGDEVLVYVEIHEAGQLYDQISNVYSSLDGMIRRIGERVSKKCCHTGCAAEHCQDVGEIINTTLGIKATAWIAECTEDKESHIPNIIYKPVTSSSNRGRIDFLGRDIDEGFRIAKYAVKNKLIVSPLLAWLIWKAAEEDADNKKVVHANLKITAYVQLKGVWRNRKVPVIMFHQNFERFDTVLDYDELDLESFSNIKDAGGVAQFLSDKNFSVDRIDQILKNISRYKEALGMYDKLRMEYKYEQPFEVRNKHHEFHIACVVFTEEGKLLLHVDEDRGIEFGCVVNDFSDEADSWSKVCQQGYLKKYGLEIKVEELPAPVATYSYEKDSGHHVFGLIIVSQYIGKKDAWKECPGWGEYTEKDINRLKSQKCVDNFENNLIKAFAIWGKGGNKF